MRFLFLLSLFISLTEKSSCQNKSLILFRIVPGELDTALYLTVRQSPKGFLFEFPAVETQPLYILKKDSTFEKIQSEAYQSVFGPYKFKWEKDKILFLDRKIGKKYRDLYELSNKEHLAPNLFSSNTDTYNIPTQLLDSTVSLMIGQNELPCFKFFQQVSGHNPFNDKYYRIVYIDKATYLPYRIETYVDNKCQKLMSIIFSKSIRHFN